MKTTDYLNPDVCHEKIMESLKPSLRFKKGENFKLHKENLRNKYLELLGDMPDKVPLNICVEWTKEYDTFTEKRFLFDVERYAKCPCHLWIPKNGQDKHPVVICIQGHSSGMHISMGRPIYDGDEEVCYGGDRDFARQIIENGYAALVIEQRALGERKNNKMDGHITCPHTAMVALLLGRTLIGERVWDISRAIDALEFFSEIDISRVAVMGNSGGGTATYYAACFDDRIKIAMPSCSVCTYGDSITALRHCDCNYIPRAAKYFDMADLAALIAPRPLIIVAGKEDDNFLYCGVEKTYDIIKELYKEAGVPENCRLVTGEEGHRFYADIAWEAFKTFDF